MGRTGKNRLVDSAENTWTWMELVLRQLWERKSFGNRKKIIRPGYFGTSFYMFGFVVSTPMDSGEIGALKELAETKQIQHNGLIREQFNAKLGELK